MGGPSMEGAGPSEEKNMPESAFRPHSGFIRRSSLTSGSRAVRLPVSTSAGFWVGGGRLVGPSRPLRVQTWSH